jgi:hypothetical protein
LKIVQVVKLIATEPFSESEDWRSVEQDILSGITAVQWPPKSGAFYIYPESGKGRGRGNGVKPLKEGMMTALKALGWKLEEPLDIATSRRPGKLDAVKSTSEGLVALEWETGNISSSHRAMNKLALGLMKNILVGGVLIVPSRELYRYLTDRVGNITELEPYLDLWRRIPCAKGVLAIFVVEHDKTSNDVPRIHKGTDGRALV